MKLFLGRLAVLSVNAGFALLILLASVAGLLHYGVSADPLTLTVASWLVTALQALYALSGLTMLLGIGLGHGDLEAFGIVVLIAGLLIRAVVIVDALGFTPVVTLAVAFNLIFAGCYVVRLRSLLRAETLLRVKPQ